MPLRWLVRSRTRLAVTTLLTLAILFGASDPITVYIRDESTSVVANMLVFTGWLLMLLSSAVCLGILFCDGVFPHRWRERVILGLPIAPPEQEGELAIPIVPKSHILIFSLVVAGLVAAGGAVLEAQTNQLFSWYQRIGYVETILRGRNDVEKEHALEGLTDARHEASVKASVRTLDTTWRDDHQSLDVRVVAARSFGRVIYFLLSSAESWNRHGVSEHWEFDILRRLHRDVAPDLRKAFTTAPPRLAAEIAYALGKLRDARATPLLVRYVQRHIAAARQDTGVWHAAVVAVGLLRAGRALGPLVALAPKLHDEPGFQTLCWATGEISRHISPDNPDKAIIAAFGPLVVTFGVEAERGDFAHRCLAVDVLRKTGDARIATPLFKVFDQPGAGAECPAVNIDIDERAPVQMVVGEPLRMRVLRALSLIAVGNKQVLRWAKVHQDNPKYSSFIRQQIHEMLRAAAAKTVESRG